MRIAFLSYDFGEYSIRHANALLVHGDVLLVLPNQLARPHVHLVDPKVDFRPFNKPRLRQPIRQLSVITWILRQVADFRPDVIHFQAGHLWFNFALKLLSRYPLTVTVHDPRRHTGDRGGRNTPQWVMDFGYRQADRVIVHGEQLRIVLQRDVGIPAERIQVIPHIALGDDARRSVKKLSPPRDANPSLLFFGRIWKYKGLDYLIRAQPMISQRHPHAKIVIAGQGEDFQPYQELMEDPSRFEVHNRWITDEERAELFELSSLVVLPYIEATQSGVVPLAYTHGKPVIATRTGGLPECVEHERTGLLVPPGDERALAAAINRLLDDDELRQSMGQAGKRKVETELSPAVIAGQTADVYRNAIRDSSTVNTTAPATIGWP